MGKISAYQGFIDKKFKPTKNDLVAEFKVSPAKDESFKSAIEKVAGESSIGTWTNIATMNPRIGKKLKPTIFEFDEKTNICKISYPLDLFEINSIPQLMSSIGGNVFGMKAVDGLRLEDIDFPDKMIKSFKGPLYGVQGVRKLLKVKKRPLVGTIVKPKVGLTPKEHAKVAYNAWLGGCDIVKDDENLTNQPFNKFNSRIKETLKLRDKVEKETGEKKVYMANITAEIDEMRKRAEWVKDHGGEYVMVDIHSIGWSGLQTVRNYNLKPVLHAHRAGHAAFTRNKNHGISMLVIAKLCRLIGMDQLHVGAIVGKMEGSKKEVQLIGENIEHRIVQENKKHHVLAEDWKHLKPMFAVCSGGVHPGVVPPLMKAMGNDIIIQMGGGIHGHPKGTIFGAKAALQAAQATMDGITIENYAKMHPQLKIALKNWGKNEVH